VTAPSTPDAPLEAPRVARAWWLAIRPKTLSAGAVPVMVGTACAHHSGQVHWGAASAALAGALLLQIGANLANDVFDFQKGADAADRVGPTRVVQAGLLSARDVTVGMILSFLLAALAGLYLTAVAGVWVVVIGLFSIAAAIAYTWGPYPLGYHGLGDVFVIAFFGFVAVVGSAWVQLGWIPEVAWGAALPPGALATAVLVVNNIRDRTSDARTGKRTLAVVLGRNAAFAEYVLLLAVAYGGPVARRTSAASGASAVGHAASGGVAHAPRGQG
jgi:1,4-dihydroxy-2-naphthoate octaprenyltransferase